MRSNEAESRYFRCCVTSVANRLDPRKIKKATRTSKWLSVVGCTGSVDNFIAVKDLQLPLMAMRESDVLGLAADVVARKINEVCYGGEVFVAKRRKGLF